MYTINFNQALVCYVCNSPNQDRLPIAIPCINNMVENINELVVFLLFYCNLQHLGSFLLYSI